MAEYTTDEAQEGPKKQKNGLTAAEENKVLEEARRRMKHAMDADEEDRKRASDELKFVWNLGNCQWDDDAKKARKSRPMLTENRNPAFIRQATNEVRRSRPQVRVLPVDGKGDPFTAQVYEGLIRNIEANSRADMAYDQATDLAAACGRGYWKVTTKYQDDGFDQDIVIEPVPDSMAIVDDPDVVYPDKSDRKFAFEVEKVDRDEFESSYGFKPETFEEATAALGEHAPYWCDSKNVFIANYWRVVVEKETLYLMSDGTKTKDAEGHIANAAAIAKQLAMIQGPTGPMPVPPPPTVKNQRDLEVRRVEWFCITGTRAISKGEWAGQYIPLVYTTCEQSKVDGKWHTKGMTFDAQDLTKANNYLLSAQIENIALTPKVPMIGPKGSFESNKAKWNSINTETYAYVEYDIVSNEFDQKPLPPPSRAPGVSAQPEIASVRMGVIDGQRSVVGLMGASLGDTGPEVAFKAIEARQARGDTAIFHIMDNLVRAVRYGGLVIADLLPRVYNGPRVVRIINPDGEPVMQAINQAFVDKKTGETKMVELGKGKYDITVSAGPAFETQRQQNNALLVQLADKIPQIAQFAPDLVTKQLLSTGDGEKIAQRLARSIDPAILGEGPSPEVKKLRDALQGLQQQMGELAKQKDFFESELMKQKSALQAAEIKNDTAAIELRRKVAELEGALAKADIELQKKEVELAKARLEAIRASMPAMHDPAAMPAPMM